MARFRNILDQKSRHYLSKYSILLDYQVIYPIGMLLTGFRRETRPTQEGLEAIPEFGTTDFGCYMRMMHPADRDRDRDSEEETYIYIGASTSMVPNGRLPGVNKRKRAHLSPSCYRPPVKGFHYQVMSDPKVKRNGTE